MSPTKWSSLGKLDLFWKQVFSNLSVHLQVEKHSSCSSQAFRLPQGNAFESSLSHVCSNLLKTRTKMWCSKELGFGLNWAFSGLSHSVLKLDSKAFPSGRRIASCSLTFKDFICVWLHFRQKANKFVYTCQPIRPDCHLRIRFPKLFF